MRKCVPREPGVCGNFPDTVAVFAVNILHHLQRPRLAAKRSHRCKSYTHSKCSNFVTVQMFTFSNGYIICDPRGPSSLDDGVASVRCVAASSSLLMACGIPDVQLQSPASSCLCVLCGITAIRFSRLAHAPALSVLSCDGVDYVMQREAARTRRNFVQLIAYSCTCIYMHIFVRTSALDLSKEAGQRKSTN